MIIERSDKKKIDYKTINKKIQNRLYNIQKNNQIIEDIKKSKEKPKKVLRVKKTKKKK